MMIGISRAMRNTRNELITVCDIDQMAPIRILTPYSRCSRIGLRMHLQGVEAGLRENTYLSTSRCGVAVCIVTVRTE